MTVVATCAFTANSPAQSNDEKKAAAQRWLARDEVKIYYDGRYKSTFTVDMKTKTIMFYGSRDTFCTRQPVPAAARVDDQGLLVFTFQNKLPGCLQLQYSFDPISKAGFIQERPGNATPETPWSGPSQSKITLVD
jgi:hypothetical protein